MLQKRCSPPFLVGSLLKGVNCICRFHTLPELGLFSQLLLPWMHGGPSGLGPRNWTQFPKQRETQRRQQRCLSQHRQELPGGRVRCRWLGGREVG